MSDSDPHLRIIQFSSRKAASPAGFLFPPKNPPHFPQNISPHSFGMSLSLSQLAAVSRNVPAAVGSLLYVRPPYRPTSRSSHKRKKVENNKITLTVSLLRRLTPHRGAGGPNPLPTPDLVAEICVWKTL